MRSTGIIIRILVLLAAVLGVIIAANSCVRVSPQMKFKFERMEGGCTDLDLSPDGLTVAAGSTDGSVTIFDSETGKILLTTDDSKREISNVVFHPSGEYIVTSGRRGVKYWEASSGSLISEFTFNTQMVRALDLTPDGIYTMTGNSNGYISIWTGMTGEHVHDFDVSQVQMTDLKISPDGTRAITSSGDGTVFLWNLETKEYEGRFQGHGDYASCVGFSPDGKYAMSGGYDARINIYRVEDGEVLRTIENPGGGLFTSAAITDLDWSPDESYILSASKNKVIRLWEVETGRLIRTFSGHTAEITVAKFINDGNYIISGDIRGAIRIWDIWYDPVEEVQAEETSEDVSE